MNGQRGSVLIVCLWIMAILSLLALGLSYRMRVEMRLTTYQWDMTSLIQMAKVGAARAAALLKEEEAEYSARNQRWSHSPDDFLEVETPMGQYTVATVVESADYGDHVLNGLEDEESRINLNAAPKDVLENLFADSPDVVAAVLDWRDPDDNVTDGGAENEIYESLEPPYKCRNGNFRSVEELLLVYGITPALYNEVKDLVTVHGSGKVNINTAPPPVLAALGLEESLVDRIVDYRRGPDQLEGTEDDGVFANPAEIESSLAGDEAFPGEEYMRLRHLIQVQQLAVKSEGFRLNVTAHARDGAIVKKFRLVITNNEDKGMIQSWRELI